MKVLLYFEKADKIKTSGIGRALKHQMMALESQGIEYTLDPKDTYDLAHINTYYPDSKRLLKKLKKKGIPVIVHGHSTIEDFRESFRCWKFIAKVWFNRNLLWFYKNADFIITPTEYSKKCIDNYNLGTEVIFVSNGIKPDEYVFTDEYDKEYFEKFNIKPGDKVVMGAGFYFKRKGLHDFIEVARKFPDVKFIWFGYLQKILCTHEILKAIKHKPDNVILPGYSSTLIKAAYRHADCFFFPSYEETEGIVVLEALTCRRPILLRDIGVYEGWMQDGVNCYKAHNNEEFAEKLEYILSHDNSKIVEKGLEAVEERTLDKVGVELKKAYERVLKEYKKEK